MPFNLFPKNNNRMLITQGSDSKSTKKIIYQSNKTDMYIQVNFQQSMKLAKSIFQ